MSFYIQVACVLLGSLLLAWGMGAVIDKFGGEQ